MVYVEIKKPDGTVIKKKMCKTEDLESHYIKGKDGSILLFTDDGRRYITHISNILLIITEDEEKASSQ